MKFELFQYLNLNHNLIFETKYYTKYIGLLVPCDGQLVVFESSLTLYPFNLTYCV
jgi:hypothetical protein